MHLLKVIVAHLSITDKLSNLNCCITLFWPKGNLFQLEAFFDKRHSLLNFLLEKEYKLENHNHQRNYLFLLVCNCKYKWGAFLPLQVFQLNSQDYRLDSISYQHHCLLLKTNFLRMPYTNEPLFRGQLHNLETNSFQFLFHQVIHFCWHLSFYAFDPALRHHYLEHYLFLIQ